MKRRKNRRSGVPDLETDRPTLNPQAQSSQTRSSPAKAGPSRENSDWQALRSAIAVIATGPRPPPGNDAAPNANPEPQFISHCSPKPQPGRAPRRRFHHNAAVPCPTTPLCARITRCLAALLHPVPRHRPPGRSRRMLRRHERNTHPAQRSQHSRACRRPTANRLAIPNRAAATCRNPTANAPGKRQNRTTISTFAAGRLLRSPATMLKLRRKTFNQMVETRPPAISALLVAPPSAMHAKPHPNMIAAARRAATRRR
jgi:hypothetical protein